MKQLAYSETSFGKYNSFAIQIFIDIERELSDDEGFMIGEYATEIKEKVLEKSNSLNPKCKLEAEKEKNDIISLFKGKDIFVEEIPNEYCSRYCCKHLPWFIVTTKKGRIKIGWRKRVIEINWLGSTIEQSSQSLFPNEDVTRFDQTIHAWSLEKAEEYINKLLN